MNQVIKILEWCKGNLVIIICGVVILLGLVSFVWPSMSKSSAFRTEMSARQAELSSIDGLISQSLTVPGPQADAPPQTIKAVVNDATIAKRKEINDRIIKDTAAVAQYAVEVNRRGLEPMMPGLFPNTTTAILLTESKNAYKAAIEALYSLLNAAMPLSAQEQSDLIALVEEEYYRELPPTNQGRLEPEQQAELARRQAARVQLAIKERARAAHVYSEQAGWVQAAAPRTATADRTATTTADAPPPVWQPGPFQIEPWAFDTVATPHDVIWEGQMQVWIQQTLVESIVRANEVYTQDGQFNTETSIINQPVKQILVFEVFPPEAKATEPSRRGGSTGTGIRSSGAGALPQPGFTPGVNPGGIPGFNPSGPGGPSGASESAEPDITYQEYKDAMLKRIEDDFTNPTGRKSNLLYDVRYAEMQLLVDSRMIPKLFNAINQTNFMTIIGVGMEDVDEYSAFASGYFYGETVDVVKLTLRVETIWLKSWLIGHFNEEHFKEEQEKDSRVVFDPGLMPDIVRWKNRLPTRDKNFKPPIGVTRGNTAAAARN